MRLLYCNACKTLDEVPDYDDHEEVDPILEKVVREHNVRDPMAHGGHRINPMRVAVVDDLEWAFNRDEVRKLINESNAKVGFDPWVGESVDTFKEDALKCWNQHRQPKEGSPCIDYMSEGKRIGRPTQVGRDALKENFKLGKTDPHLCQFCPYHQVVITEIRHKKGMYKEGA